MSNRVRHAMGRLADRMTEYAGEEVEYLQAGVDQPVRLTMWRMGEAPEVTSGEVPVSSRDADWGVKAIHLRKLVDGSRPRVSDKITTGSGVVYEVIKSPFDDEWRYADQTEQVVRIHTQRINPPRHVV